MTLGEAKQGLAHVKETVADHETRIRFIEKTIWWGGGVILGFGAMLGLIAPKIIKAMGLG